MEAFNRSLGINSRFETLTRSMAIVALSKKAKGSISLDPKVVDKTRS